MNNIKTLLHEAMHCHQQGNLFDADRWYARVIELDPDNSQALRLRGILAREYGDLDASLQLLNRAATAAPEDPDPLGEIALSYMAAGQLLAADKKLRAALQIAPQYIKGLTNLGALLQHRGHLREAISCYQQVLAKQADNIEVRCNLAKALADSADNEQALAECTIALEHSDRHPYVLATLGAVLIDQNRYSDARNALEEAARLEHGDDMALVNLALACYQLGDTESAVHWLRQAIDINPYNARAVADLANCLTAGGAMAAALHLCEEFLLRHPGERLIIGAYALALHNAGKHAEALQLTDCDKLVRTDWLTAPDGFSELADFCRTITEIICNHPSLISNPVSKSTVGMQTGELDPATHPALAALESSLSKAVCEAEKQFHASGLGQHPLMTPATENRTLRIWGTKLCAGDRQIPHMHPLGWLSGVFYPHLPADMQAAGPHAGWLEFGQPPERFYRQAEPAVRRYEPVEGKIIIFPSWFWHRTIPFESTGQRVSIAFDVMPEGELQLL